MRKIFVCFLLHVRSFQNKHRGVQPQTPRCLAVNTAVFNREHHGVSSNSSVRVTKKLTKGISINTFESEVLMRKLS